MHRILAALAVIPGCLAAPVAGEEFHLLCQGGGNFTRAETARGYATDNDGNRIEFGLADNQARQFADVMKIDITATGATVVMPAAMLPAIRGGNGGTFKLVDVRISDNAITGKVALNFLNKPTLRLDRLTGTASLVDRMTGAEFSGRCEAYDPSTVKRAF